MAKLQVKYPYEKEYLQAVHEVLESIEEVYNQHPEFEEAKIVERIVEPERVLTFKVTWVDDNVEVQTFEGMTIDFARNNNAKVIIRGLRVISDYETEMQIAQVNRSIDPSIETMFLSTGLEYSFLSSTIAKEVAYYDAGVEKLVPPIVAKKFKEKYFN